jgi:hypothetical protein
MAQLEATVAKRSSTELIRKITDKKMQDFHQNRHKNLQILQNLIFSSFVLIQKKKTSLLSFPSEKYTF